jgi:hypothetical protein
MNSSALDALTRNAGAVSRRSSLLAFGGVALATALTAPAKARAGKGGKKKAKRQCTKQKPQCVAAVTDYCDTLVDPPLCKSSYLPCCEQFTGCNVDAGIACLFVAD